MNVLIYRFLSKILADQGWNQSKSENDKNVYDVFSEFFQG